MHIDDENMSDSERDLGYTYAIDASRGDGDVSASALKDLAFLRYMLEHNKQHSQELAETGDRITAAGFARAADLIKVAVHYIDHANEDLEKAVALLSGGA